MVREKYKKSNGIQYPKLQRESNGNGLHGDRTTNVDANSHSNIMKMMEQFTHIINVQELEQEV